jgi:hypothetical protein
MCEHEKIHSRLSLIRKLSSFFFLQINPFTLNNIHGITLIVRIFYYKEIQSSKINSLTLNPDEDCAYEHNIKSFLDKSRNLLST